MYRRQAKSKDIEKRKLPGVLEGQILVVCGFGIPENSIRIHVFLMVLFVTVWGFAAKL